MNKTALMVIDVQNALVMASPYNIKEILRNIASLISIIQLCRPRIHITTTTL